MPEFEFSDAAFNEIQRLMKERSGIDIGEAKRTLVYGRLARRLRSLNLDNFDDYMQYVADPRAEESATFLNSLTTNVTELFREAHHFDHISTQMLPDLERRGAKKLRIWSAGCSTGEEPYSIAITLRSAGIAAGWNMRILATDIDSDVLAHAAKGVYALEKVEKLPANQRRWFLRGTGANSEFARAKQELRDLITFRQLNLQGSWPMQGPFDAIFCRNVVIYFDGPTREKLVRRFADLLAPGGYLFMGHSESLTAGSSKTLDPCGKTIYRKPVEAQRVA
jgi:chemotaxis protein methyltransferase CheR